MTESPNPIIPQPIELGTMLFTMVEPRKGHEVEYNRWYERDHFYGGCLAGPYLFSGRRWVATKDLKAKRFPQDSPIAPSPEVGSYLAVYWVLAGTHDDWNRWSVDQVQMLHRDGRMFGERDHIHTVLYEFRWAAGRDEDGVPVELALEHPYDGMIAVIGERDEGTDMEAVDGWFKDHFATALSGTKVGQVADFNAMPLLDDAPPDVPRDPATARRFMQLWFVEDAPERVWSTVEETAKAFDGSGLGRIVFASPFKPTIPGTDTYTDQLW
jgi:hypothetical protein